MEDRNHQPLPDSESESLLPPPQTVAAKVHSMKRESLDEYQPVSQPDTQPSPVVNNPPAEWGIHAPTLENNVGVVDDDDCDTIDTKPKDISPNYWHGETSNMDTLPSVDDATGYFHGNVQPHLLTDTNSYFPNPNHIKTSLRSRKPSVRKQRRTLSNIPTKKRRRTTKNAGELFSVRCNICKESFGSLIFLQSHMTSHDLLRPYRCNYCQSTYAHIKELQVHLDTHSLDLPFACDICDEFFSHVEFLRHHMKDDHMGIKEDKYVRKNHGNTACRKATVMAKRNTKSKFNSQTRYFIDNVSSNSTSQLFSAYVSLPSLDEIQLPKATKNLKPLRKSAARSKINRKSNKVANKMTTKTKHIKLSFLQRSSKKKVATSNPSNPAICEFCSEVHEDIRRHYYSHSATELKSCSQCDIKLVAKNTVVRHFILVHKRKRNLRCKLCHIVIGSEKDYLEHFLTLHPNNLPIGESLELSAPIAENVRVNASDLSICEICCEVHANMKRHQFCHTVNHLSQCGFCDLKLANKSSLTRHYVSMHKVNKNIPCRVCHLKMRSEKKYKRHMLTEHPTRTTVQWAVDYDTDTESEGQANGSNVEWSSSDASDNEETPTNESFNYAEFSICPFCCEVLPCLKKHQQQHNTAALTTCGFCEMKLATKNSTIRHYKKVHQAHKKLNCKICEKNIGSEKRFIEHYLKYHQEGEVGAVTTKEGEQSHDIQNSETNMGSNESHGFQNSTNMGANESHDFQNSENMGLTQSHDFHNSKNNIDANESHDLQHSENNEGVTQSHETETEAGTELSAELEKDDKRKIAKMKARLDKMAVCEFCCEVHSNIKNHRLLHQQSILKKCGFCDVVLAGKMCVMRHYNRKHLMKDQLFCKLCQTMIGSEVDYKIHYIQLHAAEFKFGCETMKELKKGDKSSKESVLMPLIANQVSNMLCQKAINESIKEGKASRDPASKSGVTIDISFSDDEETVLPNVGENIVFSDGDDDYEDDDDNDEDFVPPEEATHALTNPQPVSSHSNSRTVASKEGEQSNDEPKMKIHVDWSSSDESSDGELFTDVDQQSIKLSVCQFCCEVVPYIKQHQLQHAVESLNKCGFCGIKLANKGSVIRHYKIVHRGHQKLNCRICERIIGSEKRYMEHYLKLHQQGRVDAENLTESEPQHSENTTAAPCRQSHDLLQNSTTVPGNLQSASLAAPSKEQTQETVCDSKCSSTNDPTLDRSSKSNQTSSNSNTNFYDVPTLVFDQTTSKQPQTPSSTQQHPNHQQPQPSDENSFTSLSEKLKAIQQIPDCSEGLQPSVEDTSMSKPNDQPGISASTSTIVTLKNDPTSQTPCEPAIHDNVPVANNDEPSTSVNQNTSDANFKENGLQIETSPNSKIGKNLADPTEVRSRQSAESTLTFFKKQSCKLPPLDSLSICYYCCEVHRNMKRHILSHNLETLQKCGFCQRKFSHQRSVLKHYKYTHVKNDDIVCKACYLSFATEDSYKQHFLVKHSNILQKISASSGKNLMKSVKIDKNVCEICCEVHRNIKKHRVCHPPDQQRICGFCGLKLATRGTVARHYKTNHKNKKNLHCQFCNIFIGSEQKYVKHYETEHGDGQGEMEHADHDVKNDSESELEQNVCYPCELCEQTFVTPVLRESHMLIHKDDQLTCDVCDRVCYGESQLAKHKRSSHSVPKPQKCPLCAELLPNRRQLLAHINRHNIPKRNKSFGCESCTKKFSSLIAMELHIKRFHDTNAKFKFQCKTCGKGFDSKSLVRSHNLIHSGEKPFMCEFCGKGFRVKITLQMHLNRHTGERPYKCNQCEKSFKQLSTLQTHQRQHTGARPYVCHECGKSFSDLSNFHSHRRSNHKHLLEANMVAANLTSLNSMSAAMVTFSQL